MAAGDFYELLVYRPAPFRDKAWTLRQAATELTQDARSDEDYELLARICSVLVLDKHYLEACWLIVRLRDKDDKLDAERAARVLNHLYSVGKSQLALVLLGLGGFAEDFKPVVKTLDMILETGFSRSEVVAMIEGPRVFVSYAREDHPTAQRIYDGLTQAGFATWLDTHKLRVGDDWEMTIEDEIESVDFAIPCLSQKSVSKIGFFQTETRRILSRQERHPKGTSYVLPVRLDQCDVPRDFRRYHYVDLFPDLDAGIKELVNGIHSQWSKRERA